MIDIDGTDIDTDGTDIDTDGTENVPSVSLIDVFCTIRVKHVPSMSICPFLIHN